MSEPPKHDERLSKLDADLLKLELGTKKPTRPEKKMPRIRAPLSDTERMVRRVLLWIDLAWTGFIFALTALLGESWTLWDWLWGLILALCVAFGLYGFQLIYWEMGRSMVRMVRARFSRDAGDGVAPK